MAIKSSSPERSADEEWHRVHRTNVREARITDEANDPSDHSTIAEQGRHIANETVRQRCKCGAR